MVSRNESTAVQTVEGEAARHSRIARWTVHLVDGAVLEGELLGRVRPEQDLVLCHAGAQTQVAAAQLALLVGDLDEARTQRKLSTPQLQLQLCLKQGPAICGALRWMRTLPHGLWLRVQAPAQEQLIYVRHEQIAKLDLQAGISSAVLDQTETAAAPDPQTAAPQSSAPSHRTAARASSDRVLRLQSLTELRRYLDHLAGQSAAPLVPESLATLRTLSGMQRPLLELAARLDVPLVSVQNLPLPLPAASALPLPLLRRLGALPLLAMHDILLVAMVNPADHESCTALGFATSMRVVPLLAEPRALQLAFSRSYDRIEDEALVRSLGLDGRRYRGAEVHQMEAERLASEKPVVGLVSSMISDAIHRRASDIHLRPGPQDVELLYRIDGELVPVRRFLSALLPALVSRIKVMGGMNIAEHRVPQDGRVSVSESGRAIDLRISMLPTVHGEAVVLRLLNANEGLRRLPEIGFLPDDVQQLRDLLVRGHGLILATGPTGCGKSTTLYSALLEVREQNVNIITVEDPVEYRIGEIEQIQVNRAAGTTFASTLRNILRHDPDVIMIGEIRDHETAEIAVESALTGHLVLSTLHTNSAATTVTRLLDLGVEPFLLRSTLLAALAQRLARRNCPQCASPDPGDPHLRRSLDIGADEMFKIGLGCPACGGTGVHGRTAVYELLTVSPEIRRLIVAGADADQIHALAVEQGMRALGSHALTLARAGSIPLVEAFRIRVE